MSYEFTQGHYRAFVRTTYKDEHGTNQTVDGDAVEFDCEGTEGMYVFHSNPAIKVDPNTLEVPDATLESSGTYKGLDYSIYDNKLCVVSGTQTEAMTDEDETPWRTGVYYIYTKCTIIGGYVFRNQDVKELKTGRLNFVSGNTENPNRLFEGISYLYMDVRGLDTSNTNTLSYMFYDIQTDDLVGLEAVNVHSGITSLVHYTSGLYIKSAIKQITLNVDTSGLVENSYGGAFGLTGSGIDLTVHANVGYMSMFSRVNINHHALKSLSIIFDSYSATNVSINGTGAKQLNIVKFDTTGIDAFNSTFYNCDELEKLVIYSDSGFLATPANSAGSMFSKCSKLQGIYDENDSPYMMDVSNLFYATNMFEDCSSLEILPWNYANNDFANLFSAGGMFKNAFKQTDNHWPYIRMNLSKNMVNQFDDAFSGSHFKGINIIFSNSNFMSFPTFARAFQECDAEEIEIGMDCARANTGYSSSAEYFTSAAAYCHNLKYFRYVSSSSLAVYVTGTLSEMFEGCENLEEVDLSYLRLASSVSTYKMLHGCTKLKEFVTPAGSLNFSIDLPKTMYNGGTAYTVATLKNTRYTSTP